MKSAGITMDHSNYCTDVDHDTQEKIYNREEKSIHTQQLYN